jgi:hypothetical protein
MAESTFNTKLRNPGVRLGPHWVSPRAVSWVWGCRPPSLVVRSSISRRLFLEPCMLGGHLAGLFPPILHPSPLIFKPFFRLYFPHKAKSKTKHKKHYTAARHLRPHSPRLSPLPLRLCWPPYHQCPVGQPCLFSPPLSPLLRPSYPACGLPLLSSLPFLRRWCCESKIAIPLHNLDINASAFDDFCPSLLSRGGVRSRLVGILSPPTIRRFRGVVGGCRSPFVVGLIIPSLLLRGLPLHSLPSVLLHRGSGGGGVG